MQTDNARVVAAQAALERHGEALGRFALALLGDQAQAEALVVEVLLDALAQAKDNEPPTSAQLFSLARSRAARRSQKAAPEGPSTSASGPAAQARSRLARLKPSLRETLALRYTAAVAGEELALVLGLNRTESERRLSQALIALSQTPTEGL